MKILKETPSELIIYENGSIDTIANEPYTKVSRLYFNKKRIMYNFVPGVSVQETYNPRVFNVVYDRFRMLSKPTDAGKICSAIEEHWKKGTYAEFKEYFVNAYTKEHSNEFVEKFILNLSPYVKLEPHFRAANGTGKQPVFVIGNSFAVDGEGVSYYHREISNDWEFLCTVVQGANQTYRIPMEDIGWITLTGNVNNVISKIVFFLNPNPNDRIFTNQLESTSPVLHKKINDGMHESYYQNRMNDSKGYNDKKQEITNAEVVLLYNNIINEGNTQYKKANIDPIIMTNLIDEIKKRTRCIVNTQKITAQLTELINENQNKKQKV